MNLLERDPEFASFVAKHLSDEAFVVVSVGAAGPAPSWQSFESKLDSHSLISDSRLCQALQARDPDGPIKFRPLTIVPDADTAKAFAERAIPTTNPWDRLAVSRSMSLRGGATPAEEAPAPECDFASFLESADLKDIDFVHLDVDRDDLALLTSMRRHLSDANVLGVCVKVNHYGSPNDTDNTFHNTDRLLRAAGFELFDLDVRRYSVSALPSRYLNSSPSESLTGRPYQGDAVYLRDLCAPQHRGRAGAYSPDKLAKLAALFAMCGLPDHAAEVFLTHRSVLSRAFDMDAVLDLLTSRQTGAPGTSYSDYMTAFQRDDESFYHGVPPARDEELAQRLCEATAEIRRLEQHATELQTEIAALRASKSWRLTSPLRAVSRQLV